MILYGEEKRSRAIFDEDRNQYYSMDENARETWWENLREEFDRLEEKLADEAYKYGELCEKCYSLEKKLATVKQERDLLNTKYQGQCANYNILENRHYELKAENRELREALEDIKHLSEIRRDTSEPDMRDKADKSLIRAYALKALKKDQVDE